MENAMDHKMQGVGRQGYAGCCGFVLGDAKRDRHVPQISPRCFQGWKREHVRRRILAAEARIQRAQPRVVCEKDCQLPMFALPVIPGEPRVARRGKETQEPRQNVIVAMKPARVSFCIRTALPPGSPSLERARYARVLAGDDSFGVYGTVC